LPIASQVDTRLAVTYSKIPRKIYGKRKCHLQMFIENAELTLRKKLSHCDAISVE